MMQALDINTKAVISTGNNRAALCAMAIDAVGVDGFCIRSLDAAAALPKNWAASTGQWWF